MRLVAPSEVDGAVEAPPSKSMTQRAFAAAALARGTSEILNPSSCEDALAAMRAAEALGAKVRMGNERVLVEGTLELRSRTLDCGESGLCMRMFSPIAALFDGEITLIGRGSLLDRPVGMVEGPLKALDVDCRTSGGKPPVVVRGPLDGGNIALDGSTTSQFLSGLLMALPLCKRDSKISVTNLKSKQYVRMTLELLRHFGIEIWHDDALASFNIGGKQAYKATKYAVEGDWSGAAFPLVAGAVAGRVEVRGLRMDSLQPDRAIVGVLEEAGATVKRGVNCVAVERNSLKAFEFDASECPDLFPPLAALACNCEGKSVLRGAERLKHKESDRAAVLAEELGKLGASIQVNGDAMEVVGRKLKGGEADSRGDHRIAMACAIAALNAEGATAITGAECVSKSYPRFFDDLKKTGVELD